MTNFTENVNKYSGKAFSHFEDEYGNKLDNLHMVETLTIVFDDGERIVMGTDWYGSECYFSQKSCYE